jgi:alpha-galactosidase
MKNTKNTKSMKIAIIGAGSVVFSKNVISDLLSHDALKDCTLALMDVNAERLGVAAAMARSISATRGAAARVQACRDRKKALEGADFIINTIGVGGLPATKVDLLLPQRFGLKQTIGDTLGIGGIFRSLRSIPVVLDLCRDAEELCPHATLINYVNPMATHTLAIQRASKIRSVGLCHGVQATRGRMIALVRLAEMSKAERRAILKNYRPEEDTVPRWIEMCHDCFFDESVETLAAGINHMAAFLVFSENGKDLYPALRRAVQMPEIWNLVETTRMDLFKRLGYYFTETSGHISEYLPWFLRSDEEIRRLNLRPNCYLGTCANQDALFRSYQKRAAAGEPFIRPDEPVSLEYSTRIINAMTTNQPYVFNGNMENRNGSLITNLPAYGCVEVPCVADRTGLHPTTVGALPPQVAAMISTNMSVQELVVRAVLEEKKEYVYHAAMMDPNTGSSLTLPQIWKLVDEMIRAHGSGLPRFAR